MKNLLQKKRKDTLRNKTCSTPISFQKKSKHYTRIIFLALLLFSLCLVFITDTISKNLRNQEHDINKTLHQYLSNSFSSNINNLYTYKINQPMTDFFDSSTVTSFLFCTPQYPPSKELKDYLQKRLSLLIEENNFITASAVYAAASNTYISSQSPGSQKEAEFLSFCDKMIYDYNSSNLDKNKISGTDFNTFLFNYGDYIVFSKDLSTLSGSSHATIFMLLDSDAFSSFIYEANGMIPYQVSVYDSHNDLLFSNTKHVSKTIYTQLSTNAADGFASRQINNVSYIYCRSDIAGLQYLIEMDLITLPNNKTQTWFVYLLLFLVVILIVSLTFSFCCLHLRKSATLIATAFDLLNLNTDSLSTLPKTFEATISHMLLENESLKKIIHATSSEAISHLFAKLITGEPVKKEEAEITLSNTGYNFCLNDIYIAGIMHQTTPDFIKASERYRILNMLNSIFDKFKEKNKCNLCAFLLDEKSFVIIASFPEGTSIAKGKTKINDLTGQIKEGISLLKLPMTITFGHMYNSILDLSFSYNEAFKSMHYTLETIISSENNFSKKSDSAHTTQAIPNDLPISSLNSVESEKTQKSSSTNTPDFLDQLDRRASQIAQLIWNEKETQLSSLIERTLSDIFQSDKIEEQEDVSRRLISAVIGCMISYPYVNDSHLSDVYSSLSSKILEGPTSEELLSEVQESLHTLCNDFSEAVKKQRNPYIIAAQEYICNNYQNPELSLEEIANHLKLAPNYLSTIFSKNLGIKLFEYITEYRLEKSIEMLLYSSKTVNDISTECGFGSSRNYIRVFKKYKDTTPGAYRKQHISSTNIPQEIKGDSYETTYKQN